MTDGGLGYAGNYIYENGTLQFFNHPEGYVTPNTGSNYAYVFQYKDHLDNIRLSYADADDNGSIDTATEIIEENNYYPFGLKCQSVALPNLDLAAFASSYLLNSKTSEQT